MSTHLLACPKKNSGTPRNTFSFCFTAPLFWGWRPLPRPFGPSTCFRRLLPPGYPARLGPHHLVVALGVHLPPVHRQAHGAPELLGVCRQPRTSGGRRRLAAGGGRRLVTGGDWRRRRCLGACQNFQSWSPLLFSCFVFLTW